MTDIPTLPEPKHDDVHQPNREDRRFARLSHIFGIWLDRQAFWFMIGGGAALVVTVVAAL